MRTLHPLLRWPSLRAALVAVLPAVLLPLAPAAGAEDFLSGVDVRGYLDARLIATDDYRSWFNNGLGKAPWGNGSGDGNDNDGSEITARFAEGILVATAQLGWSTSAVVQLQYNDHQSHALDVSEAYLRYRPVSTGALAFEGKLGAFFPPGSLENTALGWSSPYTLTSSAINSWLGEEFRIIGGEGTFSLRGAAGEARLGAAIFRGGDPAGALLAWRGWALHDFELGLFDSQPLPPLPALGPFGYEYQGDRHQPFDELDHRLGFLVNTELRGNGGQHLQLVYYNNKADPEGVDEHDGQYGWRTYFWNLGLQFELPAETTLIGQAITGNTAWGPKLSNGRLVVDVDFDAAFLLLSHARGEHRFTARYDWFRTDDRDILGDFDNNAEHGRAWTAAWIWRPWEQHRFSVELLHIVSDRPARATIGVPARNDDTVLQLGYRFFFALPAGTRSARN